MIATVHHCVAQIPAALGCVADEHGPCVAERMMLSGFRRGVGLLVLCGWSFLVAD